MGLEAVAQLLDCLCTDAVDAQQVILGLADEVPHGLDADLAELVGPALRHLKVIVQVEFGLVVGEGTAVLGVTTIPKVAVDPLGLLGKLFLDVLEEVRSRLGQRFRVGLRRYGQLVAVIGELDIIIGSKARTGRDLLADDNVGLEVQKVVHLTLDGTLGEDAGGTDERRAREPRVDGARDLKGSEDDRLSLGGSASGKRDVADRVGEGIAIDVLAE